MNIIFTSDFKVSDLRKYETEIRSCLRNEPIFSPKEKTLDFIKNFARSFRTEQGAEANIDESRLCGLV